MGFTMIWRLFKTSWVLSLELPGVLKNAVFRLEGTLEHAGNFTATVKFYTHPNDVLGILSCHNNKSDLCHFLGQA